MTAPMVLAVLHLDPPLRIEASDCWCPSAPGTCRTPFERVPASLAGGAPVLSAVQEVAMVLSGSILEHLRAGRPRIAAQQAVRLASLTGLA